MTGFEIERVPFARETIAAWSAADPRRTNWPVVYTIDGEAHVYVGETTQVASRMQQHLASPDREHLAAVRVIVDDSFNKSVCLDLEAFLIRMFAGDGKYTVDNGNHGLTNSDYYQRDTYREQFASIFEQLRSDGLFEQSVAQIENSDLFKLSPYKALSYDQREAVVGILENLLSDMAADERSIAVVQGRPGTGKTVVGIYLMKLLADIQRRLHLDDVDSDSMFTGFFTEENAQLLESLRPGLVIPQQSLRKTVKNVFRKTPGLSPTSVLSPMQVGESIDDFDLLIVDEAHRLQQLSATIGAMIKKFKDVNVRRFGDERGGDQLDWMREAGRHCIFLLDVEQTVKPADLPSATLLELEREAEGAERLYPLHTQMRVQSDEDYIGYVRSILTGRSPTPVRFRDYDFKLFDDLGDMRRAIASKEDAHGLARTVAGYAWKWRSKKNRELHDIEIGDQRLRWNVRATDWINSPTSVEEVGSIHTVQGYDLNYAGVIIGPDLRFDATSSRLYVERSSYFDTKGKINNKMLGITYTDDDLLKYITNIYVVLMTRGILGTYIYVCDPELREHLRQFIPGPDGRRVGRIPDTVHDRGATLDVEFNPHAHVGKQEP